MNRTKISDRSFYFDFLEVCFVNKMKLFLIMLTIIISICIFFIVKHSSNTSSDMSKLIENSLSKQYGTDAQIEIFDTCEINFNNKIVGFTIDDSKKCGFAVMKEDGDARYELVNIYTSDKMIKRAFNIYNETVYLNEKQHDLYGEYFVVLSRNDELSKIQIAIGYGEPTYYVITSTPSLTVIGIPFGTSHFEYLYYDKSGNLIR